MASQKFTTDQVVAVADVTGSYQVMNSDVCLLCTLSLEQLCVARDRKLSCSSSSAASGEQADLLLICWGRYT